MKRNCLCFTGLWVSSPFLLVVNQGLMGEISHLLRGFFPSSCRGNPFKDSLQKWEKREFPLDSGRESKSARAIPFVQLAGTRP